MRVSPHEQVFAILVTWSDEERLQIYRRYSDFFSFHVSGALRPRHTCMAGADIVGSLPSHATAYISGGACAPRYMYARIIYAILCHVQEMLPESVKTVLSLPGELNCIPLVFISSCMRGLGRTASCIDPFFKLLK